MFELWAKSKKTKKYELIRPFDDERQFYFMIDSVNPEYYSEAMIMQGRELKMYFEFKEHRKYFSENVIDKKIKKKVFRDENRRKDD